MLLECFIVEAKPATEKKFESIKGAAPVEADALPKMGQQPALLQGMCISSPPSLNHMLRTLYRVSPRGDLD